MAKGRNTKALIKRAVKSSVALAGRILPVSGGPSRILTYHSVGQRDHEMNVTPQAFREQMACLAERGTAIPVAQAATGAPGIAVTFDDGYQDTLTNAAPILAEFAIPATVYIVAGRVGGVLDHDHDPATSRLLSWDEIRALDSAGITLGAHTLTHRRLSTLSADEQRNEIIGSVNLLADRLGHAVESFAYPFGTANDYNATSVQSAQESGVQFAVSNRYGTNRPGADLWTLRRIWIDATDDIALFRAKIDGRLDLLAVLDSSAGVAARRMLNRFLRTT